jgi:hypothetical protein
VADKAIILDSTPPIAGTVLDGPVNKVDLTYTKHYEQV